MASVDSLGRQVQARAPNRGQRTGMTHASGGQPVAPRSKTHSQPARSGSSETLEHAMTDAFEGHEAGTAGEREAKNPAIPSTIPLHSINGQFKGTFHLHEYLGTSSSSSPYTRLQACVTEAGSSTRITPREAEMRAGKGSRKSWKLTLMTTHAGQQMTLQKYFTLLGVEKPRNEESTSDPMEEQAEQVPKRCAWAPGGGEGHEEPHRKRLHSDGHEARMGRRMTDESGTGGMRLDYRRDSMTALSFGSHRDSGYYSGLPELHALSSQVEIPLVPRLSEPRYALPFSNHAPAQLSAPLSTPLSAFANRAASAGLELGSTYLSSSALTSSMNREASADMETLLRSYELSKRLSTATAATNMLSFPSGAGNLQLHGLGAGHELDRWSMPQTTMLMQNSRLFPVQTVMGGGPTSLSNIPALNRWLPVGTCVLGQGIGPSAFNLTPQESSRQFQISAEAASQYGNRFQLSRPPPVTSLHRQSETNSAPTLSELSGHHGGGGAHTARLSQASSVPRLPQADPVQPEDQTLHSPSMSGLRQPSPFDHLHPSIDKPDLSKIPETIPIFTPNQEVRGTLHLHEYVAGTLVRPNRPPPCVVLEPEDTEPSGSASEPVRVTPRTAEAKAGREARKNWKETFRTVHEGRVISLKAFFAMHNIN